MDYVHFQCRPQVHLYLRASSRTSIGAHAIGVVLPVTKIGDKGILSLISLSRQ